jgi:uncharacterized protein involved in exopolysaccharide biosynthesis
VASSDNQEFERVEQARVRLEQALAELEQIVDDKAAQATTAGEKTDSDAVALRAENARLKTLTDDVSTRLDATIERLQALLKG